MLSKAFLLGILLLSQFAQGGRFSPSADDITTVFVVVLVIVIVGIVIVVVYRCIIIVRFFCCCEDDSESEPPSEIELEERRKEEAREKHNQKIEKEIEDLENGSRHSFWLGRDRTDSETEQEIQELRSKIDDDDEYCIQ